MVDRNYLLDQLNDLSDSQWEELIFRLGVDEAHMRTTATKSQRSIDLIRQFEPQQNGLQKLQDALGKYTQPTNSSSSSPAVQRPSPVVQVEERKTFQDFSEDLGNGIKLEMVAIPGGLFLMGSPSREAERSDDEGPQHRVEVSSFWMGKYAVTQSQWWMVAKLPKIQRDLDPDPSDFKGDHRPVECVSWYEAVEFCDRLSRKTDKKYRLPSEAEWEYACRAGTTTPFHFGETITTDLANYRGTDQEFLGTTYLGFYGKGPRGTYREQTTDVGTFPPNTFGLYDMHGNVWEWCTDHWHDNYQGAPIDGSAWLTDNKDALRLLRGGSWLNDPRYCRSAFRGYDDPGSRVDLLGFRVVCVLA